ncbi:hypothetical protein ACW4TU_31835 [Streptomyces sp. QTS52]
MAALAAWWFMDRNIAIATISGLLLIIVGVTVVVTGGGEQLAPVLDDRRDPRLDWATCTENPTVMLTCHGVGAFGALHMRKS